MRKITKESCHALESGNDYKNSNTRVINNTLFLHGNKIATVRDGKLYITNAGWTSNTTKERLNGLDGVSINQKDFTWYLNGKEWNGQWTRIYDTGEWKYQAPVMSADDSTLFSALGMLSALTELMSDTPEEAQASKERMLFTTMRTYIPEWQEPEDWSTLTYEQKKQRTDDAIKSLNQ